MAFKIFSSNQCPTGRDKRSPLPPLPRRTTLTLLASPFLPFNPSTSLASTLTVDNNILSSRVDTLPGPNTLIQPRYNTPWENKQIYYPRWMFGEWNVQSTFTAIHTPLGNKYVPDGFLQTAHQLPQDGGVGSTYEYSLRFYSTLPDTLDNNMRVALGLGMPHDAIIADKAYNTRSTTDAFLGYKGAVEHVEYDPRDAPLRQSVTMSTLGPDMMPLPPRRIELYTNRVQSSSMNGDLDECSVFTTSELARQVFVAVRDVQVTDYEVLNEYRKVKDDTSVILGKQRSVVYLQPQEALYFEARNRAVAVYDYEFAMKRVGVPGDAPSGAVSCVQTPKNVVQCV